jgi:hypothetical protein
VHLRERVHEERDTGDGRDGEELVEARGVVRGREREGRRGDARAEERENPRGACHIEAPLDVTAARLGLERRRGDEQRGLRREREPDRREKPRRADELVDRGERRRG